MLDFNKNDFNIVIDDNKLKQNRYIPGKNSNKEFQLSQTIEKKLYHNSGLELFR